MEDHTPMHHDEGMEHQEPERFVSVPPVLPSASRSVGHEGTVHGGVSHGAPAGPGLPGHGHNHHMVTGTHVHDPEDFKKRFIVSAILTIPILVLSPAVQTFV